MIFVGDIAVPNEACSKQLDEVFEDHHQIFSGKDILCNLEGLLMDISTEHKTPILFNHPSVLTTLIKRKLRVAGLANNHTLDMPEYFQSTKATLNAAGIAAPGAGLSREAADQPAELLLDGHQAFVFNHCWHVMLQHQQNPAAGVHVSTIQWENLLDAVITCKKNHPKALILVMMHWSFDLETLPFPIYRQFSKALINAGVNVVAGCHSHCVQGAEAYNDGYIVYGLGNFFVPWHTFINGTIHFPEFARREMAFEWNPDTNKAHCHWFEYRNVKEKHFLEYTATEDFEAGKLLRQHSPFTGMSPEEYLVFYKKNRRKKHGIPVYKDHQERVKNRLSDRLVIMRIRMARMLAKYKFRQWNN